MATSKQHPCPHMRSQSRGMGFKYFSGPLKDVGDELVAQSNRIFRVAADGFQQHGRGAVQWSEMEFVPQPTVIAEIADPYATKCVSEYAIGRQAIVLVRRPDGAALFSLASGRRRVRRGPRQPYLGAGPQEAARPAQRVQVAVVEASVIWSRGFAASAAEAARRAQTTEALPVTDGATSAP